jgi:peptidoglycan-N-acetylglucosamine deacetylase
MKLVFKLLLQKLFKNRYLVYRLPIDKRFVALTFDDGPHPVNTPLVLNVLRKYGVRATFFPVGSQVERYSDLARKILAEGHAVGMHSYSHIRADRMTLDQMKTDMGKVQAVFNAVLGSSPVIFRPPYGRLSWAQLRYCISCDIRTIMWDINPEDYKNDPEDVLRARINGLRLQSGNIVLLHDDMPTTVKVLPELIRKVREAGLSFVTLE